jgi:hypothetical protein
VRPLGCLFGFVTGGYKMKKKALLPTKTKPLFKVNIIESERGWGQKVDEVCWFKTEEAADKFVKEHNAQNNKAEVPEIYWRAEKVGWATE